MRSRPSKRTAFSLTYTPQEMRHAAETMCQAQASERAEASRPNAADPGLGAGCAVGVVPEDSTSSVP